MTNSSFDNSTLHPSIQSEPALFSTGIVIGFLSLITNVWVLAYQYRRNKKQFGLCNVFMIIPCFNGILVGLFSLPLEVYFVFNGYKWYLGPLLCATWFTADLSICSINIYSFTALAFIRLNSIRRPTKKLTTGHLRCLLAFVLVFPVAFSAAFVSVFSTSFPTPPNDCEFYMTYSIAYPLLALILVAPMIGSFAMNLHNIFYLRSKSHKTRSSTGTTRPALRDKKAMYKLLILQLAFIVCWSPYAATFELVSV